MAQSSYLFLELSILAFFLGFGWEQCDLKELGSRCLWIPALSLACFWFVIDQVALRLGLWTFPTTGTLSFRLASLPIEEYMLFFLHTLLCLILLKRYAGSQE
jgi:lycopene cyclase domain-containing protein